MNADEIIEWIYRSTGSHCRTGAMLDRLVGVDTPTFWQVFLDLWNVCDDTWEHRADLLATLRSHSLIAPAIKYMTGADRAFASSLPEPVKVWRGCCRERVRGLAWTTDRAVAERFARGHRGIPVPDPVVAEATIARAGVFFVSTERKESEIVLDPRWLIRVKVEPSP